MGLSNILYDDPKEKGYAKPLDWCHMGGLMLPSCGTCYFNIMRKIERMSIITCHYLVKQHIIDGRNLAVRKLNIGSLTL